VTIIQVVIVIALVGLAALGMLVYAILLTWRDRNNNKGGKDAAK